MTRGSARRARRRGARHRAAGRDRRRLRHHGGSADGRSALALLGNTLPTGAILVVLITILGPISGAHFNPAVTLVFALRREIGARARCSTPPRSLPAASPDRCWRMPCSSCRSSRFRKTARTGSGQWIAEAVAAFGLVFTILAGLRFRSDAIPWLVGLYITAAYWFTASTSFANPAVAIARALPTRSRYPPDRSARLHRRRARRRIDCDGGGRMDAGWRRARRPGATSPRRTAVDVAQDIPHPAAGR